MTLISQTPAASTGESDAELLHEYVQLRREASFTALVSRHGSWVQAVAQRCLSDTDAAREAVQNVFICLARKASRVNPAALGPWLHRTTVLECRNLLRREQNRRKALTIIAEHATQTSAESPAPEPEWKAAEALLDEALNTLPQRERTLVVMRYYQRQSWREIGSALGRSEDAARVALGPALERLASLLRRRGVAVPLTALTALLSEAVSTNAPAATDNLARCAVRAASSGGAVPAKTGPGVWFSTAACLAAGTAAGYWLIPAQAAHGHQLHTGRTVPLLAESQREVFDLAAMLEDLRTLEPSGNDPAKVVRLRAACARMPADAAAPVLVVLRTRQWNTDTRLVAVAFFERWSQLDPEAALTASRAPDFGGTVPESVAAVFRGMSLEDPERFVRLLNTLPEGDAFQNTVCEAAWDHLAGLKMEDLRPHLEQIRIPAVRGTLVTRLVRDGDSLHLEAADYSMLAASILPLKWTFAMLCASGLAEPWARKDEAGVRAWIETLQERSPHRWGALAGLALVVAERDPGEAMKLVEAVPWNPQFEESFKKVARQWLAVDREAAMEWLHTADIPQEARASLTGQKLSAP